MSKPTTGKPRAPQEPAPAAAPLDGPVVPRALPLIGVALALIGLAVSVYLTIEHYTSPTLLACPENSVINCLKVTTSPESVVFGIPVVWLGVGYFVVMTAANLPLAWRSTHRLLRLGRLALAVVGVGMALYLVYAELFEINAICLYCTSVHVISALLFVLVAFGTALTAGPAGARA